MGDEGSGEEQHEPGGGRHADEWDAKRPEQEADSAGELERAEGREPGPRHAYFIHVGEGEFGVREIGDSGPGIGQDRDDGDDKVVVGGCRSGQKPFV
jgi:hypothetical protein